jgi:ketosteroid isomerase-like protein
MSQRNVEVVKRFTEAVNSRDFEHTRDVLASDANLINAPGSPFKNASGLRGFRDWLRDVSEAFETWSIRVDDVIDAPDDKVVALSHVRGRGTDTGLEVEMELNSVYTLAQGKITRIEGYFTRAESLEAAGLSG